MGRGCFALDALWHLHMYGFPGRIGVHFHLHLFGILRGLLHAGDYIALRKQGVGYNGMRAQAVVGEWPGIDAVVIKVGVEFPEFDHVFIINPIQCCYQDFIIDGFSCINGNKVRII